MTESTENLILEHLRAIRATLAEHGERLSRIEVSLSTLGQQIGALTTAVYGGSSRMDDFERRLQHIERRLELRDAE
jgi:predicted nuclease with TOPRIM domain